MIEQTAFAARNQPLGTRLRTAVLLLAVVCAAAAQAGEAVTDPQITEAIQSELGADPTALHLIDVKTQDGIVTLSGTGDNLLTKERAAALARATRGVRAVINHVTVSPPERSDEEIATDVQRALALDPATEAYQVDVQVSDGVVTLTGTVESWAERELAGRVVKRVRGVRKLGNDISVVHKEERPDNEIQADVERQLEIDALVYDPLIDVSVEDGEVVLSGTVGSAAEKRQAVEDARVAGVKEVEADALSVAGEPLDPGQRAGPPTDLTDVEIERAVRDALQVNPRLLMFQPSIRVEDGTVTLMGQVTNAKAKRAAEQTAENVVGVQRVRNLLSVRPEEPVADEEVAEQVRDALNRHPYLRRHDITVSVYDGAVTLRGAVPSDFERSHAAEVAAGVSGVVAIENGLVSRAQWVRKGDWEIEEDIKSQLFWDPRVDEGAIAVEVEDGVATLTGHVSTPQERRHALANAWQGGAKVVHARLTRGPVLEPAEETAPVAREGPSAWPRVGPEFVFALIAAAMLSLLLVGGLKRSGPGPLQGVLFFFLLIFFAAWAGGVWLRAFGPELWGASWLTIAVVGVAVMLILAAATPPVQEHVAPGPGEAEEHEEEPEAVEVAFGALFWLLILLLAAAIIARYMSVA
jgi:osmotically-inducible protein OsmY